MNRTASIHRVAVVDDNQEDLDLIVWALETVGLEPVVVREWESVDAAIRKIRDEADAVVCDHQLRWQGAATYDGAELVARCFQSGLPSVLVTAYVMDADAAIRVHRRYIPGLVPRDQLDGERLQAELEASEAELQDMPPRDRVPWPSLVRILRVRDGASEPMLDAVVPQWNPHRNVSFPLRLLENIEFSDPRELEGQRFFALVNTGAADQSDLYFEHFESAGPVPEESSLE